jgi:hypothetical protein
MMTPTTFPLNDNTFVDVYGLFALRTDQTIEMVVPDYFRRGKLAKYKGEKVRLTRISQKKYGDIIEIESLGSTKSEEIRPMNINEFKKESALFFSIPQWNKQKVIEGQKLFRFLRGYNPIYFQRDKEWKKQYMVTSKTGDYFILKVSSERGSLRNLNEKTCLIIVTYNKGFKNGFMAIPLI